MKPLSCVLCGHAGAPAATLSRTLRDDDSGRFSVVRCAACGLVQLFPLPSESEEAVFLGTDQQPKRLYGREDYLPVVLNKKRPDLERRLAWLAARRPAGNELRILEVESGYGLYVDGFCEAGYDAHGLEASPVRLAVARERMRGTFHEGGLDDSFVAAHAGAFAVVFAFHRVVHARDPVAMLRRLASLVAPGGLVYIEEPNLDDELMGDIGEYALHRWQISHYNYFTRVTLTDALRRAGLLRFEVSGLQRYSLRHLLRWNDYRGPDLSGAPTPPSVPTLANAEAVYRRDRESRMTCDTLIATIEIP